MGYYFATASCFGCNGLFTFNPELVPSIRIEGIRYPVCGSCVERVNPLREENGLVPIQVLPGAYDEPSPEHADEEETGIIFGEEH